MSVSVIKALDKWVGEPLCSVIGKFTKPKALPIPKSILVLQLWGVGETILTLPAILALQKRFLECRIEILCTKRNSLVYSKLGGNVSVKEISTNPISLKLFMLMNVNKYDLVIDMEEYLNISAIIAAAVGKYRLGYSHDVRAKTYHRVVEYNDKQHASETFMDLVRAIGVKASIDRLPTVGYSSHDEERVLKLLAQKGVKKDDVLVCVSPGAAESARSRMWPSARFSELSNRLLEDPNVKILFTGTESEKKLVAGIIWRIAKKGQVVDLSDSLSLPEFFFLMKKCSLFIGNDSGPMHIAAAQGIPTIGLFGPNIPVRFGPIGKGNIAIYKKGVCEFSPCINVHKGQVPDCLYARDSPDYQKCMKAISVDDVLVHIKKG
jgi:heptosyltransferase II